MEEKTKSDRHIDWLKNNPVISKLVVLGTIILALAAITIACEKLWIKLLFPILGITPKSGVVWSSENSMRILTTSFSEEAKEHSSCGNHITNCIKIKLEEYCRDSLGALGENFEIKNLTRYIRDNQEEQKVLDSLESHIIIRGDCMCVSDSVRFHPYAGITTKIYPLQVMGEWSKKKKLDELPDQQLCELLFEKPYRALSFAFGWHLLQHRKYREAGLHFDKAGDKIYEQESGMQLIYQSLAQTYRKLSEFKKALIYYEKNLKLCEELGDINGRAETFKGIGLVYFDWKRYDRSIEYYEKALDLYQANHDIRNEAAVLRCIGTVYYNFGKYDQAILYYQENLRKLTDIGDQQEKARTLKYMAWAFWAWDKHDESISYLDSSLELYNKLGDYENQKEVLTFIGDEYRTLHKYLRALASYETKLDLCIRTRDHQGEEVTRNIIRDICNESGLEYHRIPGS